MANTAVLIVIVSHNNIGTGLQAPLSDIYWVGTLS